MDVNGFLKLREGGGAKNRKTENCQGKKKLFRFKISLFKMDTIRSPKETKCSSIQRDKIEQARHQ